MTSKRNEQYATGNKKSKLWLIILLSVLFGLTLIVSAGTLVSRSFIPTISTAATDIEYDDSPLVLGDSNSKSSFGWSADVVESAGEAAYEGDFEENHEKPTSAAQPENNQVEPTNTKMVYTASLTISTLEFDKAYNDLKALISENGGFIANEDISNGSRKSAYITARIPTENYDGFINNYSSIGTVTNKNSSAENISKRYSDTESRIQSLEVQEKRLLELEAQAANVQEMLDIEDRLQDVRSELLSARNSLSSMDTDVAYSTITIQLQDSSEHSPIPSEKEGLWERIQYAASEAWSDFTDGCEELLIGIVSNWPAAIILLLIAIVLVVVIRRHSKKAALLESDIAQNLSVETNKIKENPKKDSQ